MNSGELGLEVKVEVVRPAADAYAAEAVEALKAGKVIAVPTDTLYGFACDAWYAIHLVVLKSVFHKCRILYFSFFPYLSWVILEESCSSCTRFKIRDHEE